MTLAHDRPIVVSVANSRRSLQWVQSPMTVSEFYERLRNPLRSSETMAEYVKMKKAQQGDLKDQAGGFVGGAMKTGRRKATNMLGRDLITLDFDNIPGWQTDAFIEKVDSLGMNYAIYSTRKHVGNAPRLRLIVPTDRTMTVDEYEPCARRIAAYVNISYADPTTFEVSRLMYYPTCCSDGEYVFRTGDMPFASVDAILASYTDWKNINEWPQVPGSFNYKRLALQQGDPLEKPGIVGAFCRCFSVRRAIEELLPGIYEECDTGDDRFTYAGGSTTGGAVLYDDDKFLFSHHATDPCSGRLVNSFDLVRLHLYGDQDDQFDASAPTSRLPSFKKMCEYVNGIDEVAVELYKMRQEEAQNDFTGQQTSGESQESTKADAPLWVAKLKRNTSGEILQTIDNVVEILKNDPAITGRFGMNELATTIEIWEPLPWMMKQKAEKRLWQDSDTANMYWYLEKHFGITKRSVIDTAITIVGNENARNEVVEYLEGLVWDGVQRLDTLFIDYLGAEDSEYVRAATRKMFTAAVARAMTPGVKFDNMLILCGPQGVGKSTIIDRMSLGFFNDSISTFEGKEASELLVKVWLVEIAELDALRHSEVARVKQFLSLRCDRYRPAYGRYTNELPRRCVFFGTCNQKEFLRDTTGNRRFWPIDVYHQVPTKSVFDDLDADTIAQLWAEARIRWKAGEQLYLTGELLDAAVAVQEAHRDRDTAEGIVEMFLSKEIPVDWKKWDLDSRMNYWAGQVHGDIHTEPRERVCVVEIAQECFGKTRKEASSDGAFSRQIGNILTQLGWKTIDNPYQTGCYGKQRGYNRPKKGSFS